MLNIIDLPSLYKRDSKGKVRIWTMQYGYDNDDTGGTRTIAGLIDGKQITNEWSYTVAKNEGKVNATTAASQAKSEAWSEWQKKVDKEYFENIDDIDSYELLKPMLAYDFTKFQASSGFTQPKLDGIRCVTDSQGMHSRSGKMINSCPHIMASLQSIIDDNPTITFDGELYNHELKADFQKIVSIVRKVKCRDAEIEESARLIEYHIYDLFDSDNPSMTFLERSKWLKDNITGNKIVLVPTTKADTQAEIDDLYGQYTEAGYEGQMIRQDTPYETKRTKNLLKRKEFDTEEFEVIRVEEGLGNWSGYVKRFVLKINSVEFSAGVRGTQEELGELWRSEKTPSWATCRYFGISNDSIPRFPVIIDYGFDKRDD